MLNYRHGVHAGNFADVLKHVVLTNLLEAMVAEPSPLCYLESHAGAGGYDLTDAAVQRRRAFESGIGRLWRETQVPGAVAGYLAAVRAANAGGELSRYPGSPALAHALLRSRDQMVLYELHAAEASLLRRRFAGDGRVDVHHRDGLEALSTLAPPREGRLLALIDPPYERREEYAAVATALTMAWQRYPTGCYALWYPVVARDTTERFLRELVAGGLRRVLRLELNVRHDGGPPGMRGAGMVLVNPPPPLAMQLEPALAWLGERLPTGVGGGVRSEWLVPE